MPKALMLLVLAAATPAFGQTALQWLDPRTWGEMEYPPRYGVRYRCGQGVANQEASLQWTEHRASAAVPIVMDEVQEFSVVPSVEVWHVDTDAWLPDTNEPFPNHLWDVGATLSYRRKLREDHTIGAALEVTSPSDEPFASGEEIKVEALGYYRWDVSESGGWLFLLHYSNGREFLRHVPLPGVAYHYRPDRTLSVFAGVPFSAVRWQATDRLSVEAFWALLHNARARVRYRVAEGWSLYGGFDWASRQWLRHDRDDDDDRLWYYEKRLLTGVTWKPNDCLTLDLSGGYAWDRFFFEGEDYDDRDFNRIDPGDGAFVGASVKVNF